MTETQQGAGPSWQPPVAGTEAEHLVAALDRQRTTFRWKADGLDSAGLALTIGASTMTLGGLLKHLAFVEDLYFTARLLQTSPGKPWEDVDWGAEPGWDWVSATSDSPGRLYALYDSSVVRSREHLTAAITDRGLEQAIDLGWSGGRQPSLRRVLFDLIEEYARHTGHADLLREAVDGRVGEDPPEDLGF